MNWQDILTNLIWVVALIFPITVGGAMALYDWLVSHLPANAQKALAAHEAQVRSIVSTVVDAIEQRIPTAPNDNKKAKAMSMINQIMTDANLPEKSTLWIDALVEQAVSMMPATYDHTGDTSPQKAVAPLFPETVKAGNQSNPFLDTTIQSGAVLNPPAPITSPMPTVAAPDAL